MKYLIKNMSKTVMSIFMIGVVVLVASGVFIACNQNELEPVAEQGIEYPIPDDALVEVEPLYIRSSDNLEKTQVVIGYYAGFYYIPKNIKKYQEYIDMIVKSNKSPNTLKPDFFKIEPLKVTLDGNMIIRVEYPSEDERKESIGTRNSFRKEENVQDNLKTKSSLKSTMSLKKAKSFFKQFKNLSCDESDENVCIPFQFAADGCYARAHWMRKLMADAGYDCKKIFVYAISSIPISADTKAGCCQKWSYHVAPLVFVEDGYSSQAMVLDPGLFDSPVSKYTWTDKLKEDCAGLGDLSYQVKIKPSNVYVYNFFITDPIYDNNYYNTKKILKKYKYLSGCRDGKQIV